MKKRVLRIFSLLSALVLLFGAAEFSGSIKTSAEESTSYLADRSQYRIMGVVMDLKNSSQFRDKTALPDEWNTYSSNREIAKASKSVYYISDDKKIYCRNMYAYVDIDVKEEKESIKSIKLEWQFGALPTTWFRLEGEKFLNIKGAGHYSGLIDLSKLGLDANDTLKNVMVNVQGYSITINAMQIVMAKHLTGSGEYYQVGDKLYRQTGVAASQDQLKLPAYLTGSGSYTIQGSSDGQPVYQKGTYLAVSINVACTDDDHFAFDRWNINLGDTGELSIDLLKVMQIDGEGHYEAFIDLGQYGVHSSVKWFGMHIGLAYGTIEVSQFELLTASEVNSHKVNFLDSFGRVYKTIPVADGDSAVAPSAPIRAGYVFEGWEESFDNVTKDLNITPKYTADSNKANCLVQVTNGYFSNGYTAYNYGLSDVCTVKSLETASSGQVVSWIAKNGSAETVVGYGDTFVFRVTGPMELRAELIPEDQISYIAYCDPNSVETATQTGKTVQVPTIFRVPDGCTMMRFGTVSIQGLALNEGEELLLTTPGAIVFEGKSTNSSGQWYRNIQVNSNYYIAMRGFIEYTDALGKTQLVYGKTTMYGKEQEYVDLQLREGDQIGVWWWHPADMTKVKNRKYLNFLQKNGVTEIYGGFSFTDYNLSATFIEAANAHGLNVLALSGDCSWVTTARGEMTRTIQKCLDYNEWAKKNNRGLLAGIQLDLEPQNATQEIWKIYADEVKLGYEKTRGTGLKFEMCTSAHLDDLTADGYAQNQAPTDYNGMMMHEWVQKYSDSVVLMSYGDSADDAHQMSANELSNAQKAKACPVISGQETGPETANVTYFDNTKKYLYEQVRKLYQMNVEKCPDVSTGVAFHNVQTWYKLL